MKFTSAIVLAMAGFAVAKGNNKSADNSTGTSTKAQCKQVEKLTFLTDIAANQTKLDKITKGNTTKADDLKAKAADATTKLQTLTSNTTLMTECNSIFAVQQMAQQCGEMASIEQAQQIVANQTKLDKVTKGNTTKADDFKAKVAAKADTLTQLQANTTLTAYCASLDTKAACKTMAKLAKEQAQASNTTALNDKFKGDQTKISNFQAKLADKATKLQTLTSNTTLVDACNSLGISTAATANGTKSTNNAKSAAVNVQALAGGQVFAMVSALAFALTML